MDGLSKISSKLTYSGYGSPYGMVRNAFIVIAEGFKKLGTNSLCPEWFFSSRDFIIQINTSSLSFIFLYKSAKERQNVPVPSMSPTIHARQ